MKKTIELIRKEKPTLILEKKKYEPRKIDLRTVALKSALVNKINPLQSEIT